MRTLPPELVQTVADAVFGCRIPSAIKGAEDAINAVLDYLSKPENVTTQMLAAWLDTGGGPSHEFTAMISAIGDPS